MSDWSLTDWQTWVWFAAMAIMGAVIGTVAYWWAEWRSRHK